MNFIRLIGLVFSLLLHAAFALPFLTLAGSTALEVGAGEDLLLIEQGIAIEGLLKLGEAPTTTEAQEMPLTEASQAQPPIEEVRAVEPEEMPAEPQQETALPDDLIEVIAAKEGPQHEIKSVEEAPPAEELVPDELTDRHSKQPVVEDGPPPPVLEQPRPSQMMAVQQIEQFAVQEQQSSSEKKAGGDATLRAAYLGKLRIHLERHKVRPEAKATGTAVVKFAVDPSGKILSREITTSSGSKKLDDAAIATIERSAPFPRFPDGISREPVVVSVPFKFRAGR
jgi:protein TonB